MMESSIQLPLAAKTLQHLTAQATDYAMSHGLIVRTKEDPSSPGKVCTVPFVLLPSPFPRHCFEQVKGIQTDINLLMHRVAHDYDFLKDCLESTIKVDDFTGRLWSIYEQIRAEGCIQPYDLAVLRSDYMSDGGTPTAESSSKPVQLQAVRIKQVEINTIAASFGGLASSLYKYHRYALSQLGVHGEADKVPENRASNAIAEGFLAAWRQYNRPEAAVLFVVQENERNIYDQRSLEYSLWELDEKVLVLRRTLPQLIQTATLQQDSRRLLVGDVEVAVVYLRTCYSPDNIRSEEEWAVRLMLERSAAIKCPSVHYQLAGTKKVQQVLAQPGVLERFVSDKQAVQRIRSTFAGQYSLNMGEEGDKTVEMLLKAPHQYVLKPQREGGGFNFFGEKIAEELSRIGASTEERTAYVAMERIHPVPVRNYPLSAGAAPPPSSAEPLSMISEVGIFGVLVGSSEDIVHNKQEGHLVRTKACGTDEGGVSVGYAFLDSPYLI